MRAVCYYKYVSKLTDVFFAKGGGMVAKKNYAEGSFGAYLLDLIRARKKTQSEFIAELGISKTYFVDVLNGRVKPPAPDMQEKIVALLRLENDQRLRFYDKAAEGRKELPKDVVEYLLGNASQIAALREKMRDE